MPFVGVANSKDNTEKFEIWAKSESLLPENLSQMFLGTRCSISLYFIEKFTLKLVIYKLTEDEEESEIALRIELILDEVSESL